MSNLLGILGVKEFLVLSLLIEIRDKGKEASQVYEEFLINFKVKLSLGGLYCMLDRFEKEKLVTSMKTKPKKTMGGKAVKLYKIEKKGFIKFLEAEKVFKKAFKTASDSISKNSG